MALTGWARIRTGLAGAVLDEPRYAIALRFPRLGSRIGLTWVDLKNRGEVVWRTEGQQGVRCGWRWTSELFFCRRRPARGQALMALALQEWPIRIASAPEPGNGPPDVSFVIGHRGIERINHLSLTLGSIAGQVGATVECVVVEQAPESSLNGVLPSWVRHVHSPPDRGGMPYSRSWAFNVGARVASGRILVFHDNDICVPEGYARELVRLNGLGFESARLQRFVFYLSKAHTEAAFTSGSIEATLPPAAVVQNCEGHTVAVSRPTYFALGGHDEGFEGWGGEDNEFFGRLGATRLHDHSYLPFVHLHHDPQPGKAAVHPNSAYFEGRMRIPASERIEQLARRPFGESSGPVRA